VIGSADTGNGVAWVSTQLAPLTVAAPYVAMKIEMTTVEQGKDADVVCKLEQLGRSRARRRSGLYGLPPNVVAEPATKEITKDDKEVTFRVKVAANSPSASTSRSSPRSCSGRGRHDGPQRGRRRRHAHRQPSPSEEERPAAKPGEAPKPGEPAKRLSRLEQLRQEAEEKAKEGNK
jgi:hypothetical protein